MSVSTITGPDNGVMSSYESPSGGDGPRRRRSFTAEDKLRYLADTRRRAKPARVVRICGVRACIRR